MYEVEIVKELNLDKSCIKIDSSFIVGTLFIKNIISLENFIKVNNKDNNYGDYLCIDIVGDDVIYKIVGKEPDGYNVFTITDDGNINLNITVPYNSITKLTDAISKDMKSRKKINYEKYLKLTTFSLEVIEYRHKSLLAKNWVSEYLKAKGKSVEKSVIDYDKIGIPKEYIYTAFYSKGIKYIETKRSNIIRNTPKHEHYKAIVSLCTDFSKLLMVLPEKRFYSSNLVYTNNTFSSARVSKMYINYEEKFIKDTIREFKEFGNNSKCIKAIIKPVLDSMIPHRLNNPTVEKGNLAIEVTKFVLEMVNDLDFIEIFTNSNEYVKTVEYDKLLKNIDNAIMRIVEKTIPVNYSMVVAKFHMDMCSIRKILFEEDMVYIEYFKTNITREDSILKSFLDSLNLKIEIKD